MKPTRHRSLSVLLGVAAALLWAQTTFGQVEIIKIVDGDTPIPGAPGETFDDFSAPAIYGDRIAFQGRSGDFHNAAQSGIFLVENGSLQIVADIFTFIPNGEGLPYRRFAPPSIDGGRVCFWGQYHAFPLQEGIYCKEGDVLGVVADVHTPVPGGTGNFTSAFSGVQEAAHGNSAFISWRPEHTGVYAVIGGGLGMVANLDSEIPGGQGNFSPPSGAFAFEGVSISGSEVAFGGRGDGQEGIYSNVGGVLRAEADVQTVLPGIVGVPSRLRGPSLDRGNVSFYAGRGVSEGIFARVGGALRTIADPSTPIPGRGLNFFQFEPFSSLERHNVVFWGRPEALSFAGIYVVFFDELIKVIDTDDTLDGQDIWFVTFGPQALSGHRVAFKVTFNGFGQGLYVAILPVIYRDGFEAGDLSVWDEVE